MSYFTNSPLKNNVNKHLKPVFEVILPKLKEAQIDYWVFGGISIAAYAGNFIRENPDVDIFVRDTDFENAKSILQKLCDQINFELRLRGSKNDERPKVEIKIDNDERISMIPIYQKDGVVIFKYPEGNQEYPNQILERVERKISDYRFFTSQDEFIKKMFVNHIKAKPKKKKREEYKKDAKVILSPEELSSLNWHID